MRTPMISTSLKARLGDLLDLPEFLDIELTDINQHGRFGNTPLHLSVVRGDVLLTGAILASGANVNASGEEGYTPLHEAVEQRHDELIELLLEHGASTKVRNSQGLTALDLAVVNGNEIAQRILRSHENGVGSK